MRQLRLQDPALDARIVDLGPSQWRLLSADTVCDVDARNLADVQLHVYGDPPFPLVQCAVNNVAVSDGWVPIHASSHGDHQGRTTLTIGVSGAGKSCRLLMAARDGRRLLSEDTVWLEIGTQRLHSVESCLRLRPAALDLLLPHERRQAELDSTGKWQLPFALWHQARDVSNSEDGNQPVGIEVLLGTDNDLRDSFPCEPGALRQLHVARHIWSAIGTAFIPSARRSLEIAVAQLLALPAQPYYRTSDGRVLPI